MSKPEFERALSFDPQRWNGKLGNRILRRVFNQSEHSDSDLGNSTKALLGRKGYQLEGIPLFIGAITAPPSYLREGEDFLLNQTERVIFEVPRYGSKAPDSAHDHLENIFFSTDGSIHLFRARYLRMREAFMKLGNFPEDLFNYDLELVGLLGQAAFSRELEGGGALYNRSHHKKDEKIIDGGFRHGLAVAAELATHLPTVEAFQIPRQI